WPKGRRSDDFSQSSGALDSRNKMRTKCVHMRYNKNSGETHGPGTDSDADLEPARRRRRFRRVDRPHPLRAAPVLTRTEAAKGCSRRLHRLSIGIHCPWGMNAEEVRSGCNSRPSCPGTSRSVARL